MSRKNKQGCPQLFISRAEVVDLLLWGGNACQQSVPLLRVQKQWTHHIYMTMYELTNRSAALGPCINFNLQIKRKWSSKWSNILASCVPSWWKQIHMHLQCLPWMHPIWNFSLHRACQAENDNIVRFSTTPQKKRLKPRFFLRLKNAKLQRSRKDTKL